MIRKICGKDAVVHTNSRHKEYFIIEAQKYLKALSDYRKSKVVFKNF